MDAVYFVSRGTLAFLDDDGAAPDVDHSVNNGGTVQAQEEEELIQGPRSGNGTFTGGTFSLSAARSMSKGARSLSNAGISLLQKMMEVLGRS